jgi:hypothetical protein
MGTQVASNRFGRRAGRGGDVTRGLARKVSTDEGGLSQSPPSSFLKPSGVSGWLYGQPRARHSWRCSGVSGMTAAWIDAGIVSVLSMGFCADPSIESVLLAHANASHHNLLSQQPAQGDEGNEDDRDNSEKAKGTVNVWHGGLYLHMPVESCREHSPRSRRSVRAAAASFGGRPVRNLDMIAKNDFRADVFASRTTPAKAIADNPSSNRPLG